METFNGINAFRSEVIPCLKNYSVKAIMHFKIVLYVANRNIYSKTFLNKSYSKNGREEKRKTENHLKLALNGIQGVSKMKGR